MIKTPEQINFTILTCRFLASTDVFGLRVQTSTATTSSGGGLSLFKHQAAPLSSVLSAGKLSKLQLFLLPRLVAV